MKLSAEQQTQLYQLLSAEHGCAESLLNTVQHENKILKSNDPEAIQSISHDKKVGMKQLWDCMQRRDQWLTSHNLETGSSGTMALIKKNPATESATLWEKLSQIAIKLHDQNEINGGIVALSQRHNKQALDILCGRTEKSGSTYGSKGQQYQDSSGHSLAKA